MVRAGVGLRIADGSIVPGSLGVPPSWTIAALAERIADDLQREVARRISAGAQQRAAFTQGLHARMPSDE